MKKFNIYLFANLLIFFSSCDDTDSITKTGKPSISVFERSLSVNEGETAVYQFTVEYPINEPIVIRIDVLDSNGNILPTTEPIGEPNSGNGYSPINMEDFTIPYDTWFDSGYFSYGYLGGSGYVTTIPPYSETFELYIDADLDAMLGEQPETYRFKLSSTSTMSAEIDEEISLTINNVDACTWTLQTFDAYGDGWNGGYITATINGESIDYTAQGFGSNYNIGMISGDTYSFFYTSGGGSGQAPGWEEENTYTLTDPNGNIWSDGPIPSEGLITSGTNICN